MPLEDRPRPNTPRRPSACLRRPCGGAGAVGGRLQDHRRRHHRLDRRPGKRRAPMPNGGARSTSGAPATAKIPATPTRPSPMPRRCAPPTSAPRRSPCCSRPRSATRTTCRCSAPTAGRWPMPAITTRRSTCSTRAHTPDNPDWRILNAQGAVLDQLGRHAEAQRHYSAALKIVPDEPSVLSNLGLSYALTKDLQRAEATLRQAVARPNAAPKVRQNLALVVGPAGPLRRSRADRPRRSAAGRSRRQCRLSAADACATRPVGEKGRPAAYARARRRDLIATAIAGNFAGTIAVSPVAISGSP